MKEIHKLPAPQNKTPHISQRCFIGIAKTMKGKVMEKALWTTFFATQHVTRHWRLLVGAWNTSAIIITGVVGKMGVVRNVLVTCWWRQRLRRERVCHQLWWKVLSILVTVNHNGLVFAELKNHPLVDVTIIPTGSATAIISVATIGQDIKMVVIWMHTVYYYCK